MNPTHLLLDPARAPKLQRAFEVWKMERIFEKAKGVSLPVALAQTVVKQILLDNEYDVSKLRGLEHALN